MTAIFIDSSSIFDGWVLPAGQPEDFDRDGMVSQKG
jgi:hypothetical protein